MKPRIYLHVPLLILSFFASQGITYGFSIGRFHPGEFGEHGDITRTVLTDFGFSNEAVLMANRASAGQDQHPLQPKRHVDRWRSESYDKAYKRSVAYIGEELEDILDNLTEKDYKRALKALGRVMHTVQDAFSHSNYCDMSQADQESFIRAIVYGTGLPAGTKIAGFPGKDKGDPYGYTHTDHAKDTSNGPEGEEAFLTAKAGAVKGSRRLVELVKEFLIERVGTESAENIWEGFVNY